MAVLYLALPVSLVLAAVAVVGAGPAGLACAHRLAMKGHDVVVYDALAPPELLEAAPAAAERINVGKRGHDAPTRSQPEITALLIELDSESAK